MSLPVYNCNLPTGIPIPKAPRSPKPKIRSPSVTTIAFTCCSVQLHKTSYIWPLSCIVRNKPLQKYFSRIYI